MDEQQVAAILAGQLIGAFQPSGGGGVAGIRSITVAP